MDDGRTIFQPTSAGSVKPGTCLNGIYEIEKLIAQGGMGEVYRGFNIQTRDIVAIKMIRPELSNNPDVFDLFRREASILHTLQHEAIVRYFVFSVDPQLRRAYLAMEFVDGPSLADKLVSGALSLADVNILRLRVSSALEAAHGRGVVHRDISSDNIIFPNGEVRSAKIIDFGIARSLREGEGTIIGSGFAGKYNYVSPEQLGLAGGEVTYKSDIYSFGLVLAEALRGRPIDMTGSQAEIIEKRRVVPDLSDIDQSIRPLIRSMLQPLPIDRPPSMAVVGGWHDGSSAAADINSASPIGSRPAHTSSGGYVAALFGAILAIVSVGGAAFVFRDELARWIPASVTPAPLQRPQALPPPIALPPIAATRPSGSPPPLKAAEPKESAPAPEPPPQASTPHASEAPGPSTTQQATPNPTPQEPKLEAKTTQEGAPPVPHVPRPEDLVESMPPHASRAAVDLPPGTVDAPYRADLPEFIDPGGKGLRLAADSLPEGLTFRDLGQGKSEIEGAPKRAGNASVQVVATNHNGRTARMMATIAIAEKTPSPIAASPPSSASNKDQAAKMEAAPTAPKAEQPSAASPSQNGSPGAFIEAFDGGDCFLVKPLAGSGAAHAYLGVGVDLGPFQRFEEDYKRTIGAEPQLSLRLIAPSECPVLDLMRSGTDAADAAPRIELSSYRVGRGMPLAGTIANLGGRRLFLVLVDNDGIAYRLEPKVQPGGDSASFSVRLTPDAGSVGPIQLILAIASNRPVPALETFRSGAVKTIAPWLLEAERSGAASVETDFFVFVN